MARLDRAMATQVINTSCVIAGGGPAGVMLGYLLARAGIEVVVLEKHQDFFRDFRGDTVHPSTLQVMHELGLLEAFLKRPHDELKVIRGTFGEYSVEIADFTHLPTHAKFIAFTPQWEFLDFLAGEGRKLSTFTLIMGAEAQTLIVEDGRVAGLSAVTPDGPVEIRAELTVGADGRTSTVRQQAGLKVQDRGAPIDVLWMRLSKSPSDPGNSLGRVGAGRLLVSIDRGDYYQCAYVIPKGGFEALQAAGLDALRDGIVSVAPFLADRVQEIASWEDVKLLTVVVDRLERWSRPGLLCIGDAAHAMSPVGGVGINLAIQDAVAAANLLVGPLRRGRPSPAELDAVQRRREPPTRATQAVQMFIQKTIFTRVLNSQQQLQPPLAFRLLDHFPWLRRLPARFVGLGVRPEHIGPDLSPR